MIEAWEGARRRGRSRSRRDEVEAEHVLGAQRRGIRDPILHARGADSARAARHVRAVALARRATLSRDYGISQQAIRICR